MTTAAPWVLYPQRNKTIRSEFLFRPPQRSDGHQVNELISLCPPLDENSSYCNFLQSTHFYETSILTEDLSGQVVGFISAYRKPNNPHELFIWQVAVHPDYRGKGVAYRMVQSLLAREALQDLSHIETTITQSNTGSWSLFKKIDRENGKRGVVSTFLDEVRHFRGEHDTEYLYRIPLTK